MTDDIAKKRAALNIGALYQQTGPVQGPSLSSIWKEHLASLPQKTAKNIEHMNWMVQNANPYDYATGKPNPNYDPQAAKEFFNYVPNLMGATAWHGTPHDIKGAFDLAKVGTGEGAQVYGHGMYFAQNPKVAKEYQSKLSGWDTSVKLALNNHGGVDNAIKETEKSINHYKNSFWREDEKERASRLLELNKTKLQQLQAIKEGLPEPKGNMYKVDVPDEHIPKMLDWDKPISEQSHVWNAIPQNIKDTIDNLLESRHVNTISDAPESYTGKHLYSMLKHPEVHDMLPAEVPNSNWYIGDTTNEKHVSQYLNSLGIPGIKYLDANSRPNVPTIRKVNNLNQDTKELTESWQVNPSWNAPNEIKHFPTREEAQAHADSFGTRNYVSFDPAAVKILEKNGKPIAPPEYAPSEGVAPIPIQLNNPLVESAAQDALTQQAKMKAQFAMHGMAEQERARRIAENTPSSPVSDSLLPPNR